MKNKIFLIVGSVALILILLGYWYQSSFENKVQRAIHVSDCQISETACQVEVGEGKFLTLSILPKGMPQTKPLAIDLRLKGFSANEALVNFEGIEINHNLMPYSLDQHDAQHFSGKGFLSLCSLRTMNWLAHLIVVSDDETLKVSFPFVTVRR